MSAKKPEVKNVADVIAEVSTICFNNHAKKQELGSGTTSEAVDRTIAWVSTEILKALSE